jgi:hypothetical protein
MPSLLSNVKNPTRGECVLSILIVFYVLLGVRTPSMVEGVIETIPGKFGLALLVLYLVMYAHPFLAILVAFAIFILFKNTSANIMKSYLPSEEKKMSQFTAFNQFPYTLEQEVVAKMAPVFKPGFSMEKSTFSPKLENTHDAAPV